MKRVNLIIFGVIVLVNLVGWTLAPENNAKRHDYAFQEVMGFSYSPFRPGQSPITGKYPSAQEIDEDLRLLARHTTHIRTYGSTKGLELIPAIARKHHLRVTAGAWLDRNTEQNEKEIDALIRVANANANVDALMVGNEVILRGDFHKDLPKTATEEEKLANEKQAVQRLIGHIKKVRESTYGKLVTTAEPPHVWMRHPELAEAVDQVTIHLLPYWEGKSIEESMDHVVGAREAIGKLYPKKPVLIGEVGWPSGGEFRLGAVPSDWNQETFTRDFVEIARKKSWDYFVCEAFDQPWKAHQETDEGGEGKVGAYWGLFTADRKIKFNWDKPTKAGIEWSWQWLSSTVVGGVLVGWWLQRRRKNVQPEGLLFFGLATQATASVLIYTTCLLAVPWLTPGTKWLFAAIIPAQALMLTILLINAYEMTELLWITKPRRYFPPADPTVRRENYPKVSIHVACYNEPPAMVIKTIDSLARQTYPNLEVIVVDNNTKNPDVWKPVEAYCKSLGERFKFFHLDPWPGFKAGALNYALTQTAPDAVVVGVLDADYVVQPDWLKSVIPYFDNPKVGLVQNPQSHRAWRGNAFKEMINWEYEGFFHIGMVHRNEYNAIIQHGTMCLMRKTAMEQLGGWAEWCIVEDAEMGLRLMKSGYETVYVNMPFGKGLVPDSFMAYKKQRFRWAYGAIQILRRYGREMVLGYDKSTPAEKRLNLWQRYHFLAGWLPWFGDALHLLFTALLLVGSVALVAAPRFVMMPIAALVLPSLALSLFNLARSLWLYQSRVRCSTRHRLAACVAGLGLTYTIGRAVVTGVLTPSCPFFRTPKCENRSALSRCLLMVREEAGLFALLWLAAAAIIGVRIVGPAMPVEILSLDNFKSASAFSAMATATVTQFPNPVWIGGAMLRSPQTLVWVLALVAQSLPYGAAVISSLVAGLPSVSLAAIKLGRTSVLYDRAARRLRAGSATEQPVARESIDSMTPADA